MMLHWRQADDADDSRFNLQSVTVRDGFPTRQEMVSRYEQRSGRSMHALDWYVALAMWKAVAFMEGNYKRAVSGSTDDPYLKSFGEGVLELAHRALRRHPQRVLVSPPETARGTAARTGLLVDWGGVMTTDVFATFGAFCAAEGLSPRPSRDRFRHDPASRELLVGLEDGTCPSEIRGRLRRGARGCAREPDRADVRRIRARARDGRGRAPRPRRRDPHRA